MSSFVLIHGAGEGGWSWHLVKAELEARGHEVITPDLPADDDSLTVLDYADSVVRAVGDRDNVTVVGHSFGGFTAPIVAERLSADVLILLAAMIPIPGETPADWWGNTSYSSAVEKQAAQDGALPAVTIY